VSQKPWYIILVWFTSTSFFFIASVTLIAIFNPPPSEQQVMQFMMGMMGAMHNSLMGLSMTIEEDRFLNSILELSAFLITPLVILSIIGGLSVRQLKR